MEFAWTPRPRYRSDPALVLAALRGLTEHAKLVVEDRDLVRSAIARASDFGVDFADQFIAIRNAERGCRTTMTFDQDASATPGFSLISG